MVHRNRVASRGMHTRLSTAVCICTGHLPLTPPNSLLLCSTPTPLPLLMTPRWRRRRYNWYSNPCGKKCFGCAVYVAVEPLSSPALSGEEPFLPLPPFVMDLGL